VGERTQNAVVIALGYDHRNDIFSATAAVIGISLGLMGYLWIDPLAGALVSLVVLRTGIEILRDSTADLMDTVPGKALDEQIRGLLSEQTEVKHIDRIQAHRFGPYLVVNITICVDGELSVFEGDRISTRVEEILSENIRLLRQVHVHYHPLLDDLDQ
jgi:cation diffusion facilitator family transporter